MELLMILWKNALFCYHNFLIQVFEYDTQSILSFRSHHFACFSIGIRNLKDSE